jgi:hypothetical protein
MTTVETLSSQLSELVERDAIRQVLARYCRGADRCDAELLASCYHDDATDRHGPFSGSAREFAEWVIDKQRVTSIITQHAVSNVVIEFDETGSVAWVESAFTATHVRPPDDTFAEPFIDTFWGRYVDRFEKRGDRWAICTREVVHDWSERRAAGARMPKTETYRAGQKDRSDPSYERARSRPDN